ncbi:MAG: BON domain-containing protein [Planctomycetes bacterium]|nr:BON domain-containing protein [Planctomycetota bacterium]
MERLVRSRTGGRIRDLRVEVTSGEIILSGRTTTYYDKQLATHAALAALEDLSLTNEIEVC